MVEMAIEEEEVCGEIVYVNQDEDYNWLACTRDGTLAMSDNPGHAHAQLLGGVLPLRDGRLEQPRAKSGEELSVDKSDAPLTPLPESSEDPNTGLPHCLGLLDVSDLEPPGVVTLCNTVGSIVDFSIGPRRPWPRKAPPLRIALALVESLGVSLALAGLSAPVPPPVFTAACSLTEVPEHRATTSQRREKRIRDAARPRLGQGIESVANDVSAFGKERFFFSKMEHKTHCSIASLYLHLLDNQSSIKEAAVDRKVVSEEDKLGVALDNAIANDKTLIELLFDELGIGEQSSEGNSKDN